MENVVIAQEVVHNFKLMIKKKGSIRFKMDFQKAYNKMEQGFIIGDFRFWPYLFYVWVYWIDTRYFH